MELIAHRGCAELYPENTVYAVEQASLDFPAVEIDVRRCRSGELVVFHDETIDRVTEGSGSVAEMAWSELRELEVKRSGERIPLLSEALAAVPSGVSVQVELKRTGIAAEVLSRIHDSGVDARVTSFIPSALSEVQEYDPEMKRGYLFGEEVGATIGFRTALALGCDSLHPHSALCLETDIVQVAHREELRVIAWAVSDELTVGELHAIGVDAATADTRMSSILEETTPMAAD
ncbi:glycerophosphodiester phosphodiesterase [Haladaptatus sp. DYF46]|uniref:glycerophosphodiester phosphodiesterase n=1 Tax=Haladaptatus sp. DYF46 TaxID=2886041 RepID=UPI001E54FB66|nr:glycerophosphodiester phosphodiesterase [Haladaptatus sp. DYF46]